MPRRPADMADGAPEGTQYVRRLIDEAKPLEDPDPARASDDNPVFDVDPETGALSPPAHVTDVGDYPDQNGGDQPLSEWGDTGLPPGCPVRPLGRNKGTYWFENSDHQIIPLSAAKFSANTIMDLLDGNSAFAMTYWPNGKKSAIDASTSRDALIRACRAQGVFDPESRVRGRGAWTLEDGRLILHMGDEILLQNLPDPTVPDDGVFRATPFPPGMFDGMFYEADVAMMRPADGVVPPFEIQGLLTQLESWNWVRRDIGPILMLGWIAMAMIGGAMEARPHVIVQGGSGCGKSTLQNLVGMVLGEGKVKVADATESGLSNALRNQTVPIMFDEFEAEDDNRKAQAVIGLMRRSTSGATRLRGSPEQRANSSTNQSPFFLSMITPPPLRREDMNRLVLLQLRKLDAGTKAFKPKPADWADYGAKLLRRMLNGWPQFEARQEIFADRLAQMGHSARARDTIGNLLACADIALSDAPIDADTLDRWMEELEPDKMLEHEAEVEDFDQCLNYLLQARPRSWQGQTSFPSIGAALYLIHKRPPDPEDVDTVRRVLDLCGLGIIMPKGSSNWELLIPNSHRQVREVFEGSKWSGDANSLGPWLTTLSLGPADMWARKTGSVAKKKERGIAIKRAALLPDDGENDE